MRAALVIIPFLLAGCDIDTKSPVDGGERVTMNADASGNLQFELPVAKGNIKLPESMMANSEFDIDGVKLMPGSKMTNFNVDAGNGPTVVKMSFSAPVSPAETQAYFVDQFRAKGVNAAAAGETVAGSTKDGTAFVIRLAKADTGTNGLIELHPKD